VAGVEATLDTGTRFEGVGEFGASVGAEEAVVGLSGLGLEVVGADAEEDGDGLAEAG